MVAAILRYLRSFRLMVRSATWQSLNRAFILPRGGNLISAVIQAGFAPS